MDPCDGRAHSFSTLLSPCLLVSSMTMTKRSIPASRSIAPPIPLISLLANIQLTRSASYAPSIGKGPIPCMPLSDCSVTSTPSGMLLETSVGMAMPRLTYQPSWSSNAAFQDVFRPVETLLSLLSAINVPTLVLV